MDQSVSRRLLWRGWFEAHVWASFTLWVGCICIIIGSDGPFAQSVEDLSILLEIICGFDPNDSTSENRDVPSFSSGLKEARYLVKKLVFLGN